MERSARLPNEVRSQDVANLQQEGTSLHFSNQGFGAVSQGSNYEGIACGQVHT